MRANAALFRSSSSASVCNERPASAVLYLSVSAVPTHRNSDKVLQLELFQ